MSRKAKGSFKKYFNNEGRVAQSRGWVEANHKALWQASGR